MLEDILIIHEKHKRAAREILEILDLKKPIPRIIIAIGGESGTGKSVVSHMMSKYLKKDKIYAKIIHTDDFYLIDPKIRTQWRKEHSIEDIGLKEYNWKKIYEVIQHFKEKNVVEMPCVDLLTDQVDVLRTDFSDIDILIIEGLYALKINADVRIFIDITYRETHNAQIIREKEIPDLFRLKVLEQEHKNVQKLKTDLTIIIDKDFKVIPIENKKFTKKDSSIA